MDEEARRQHKANRIGPTYLADAEARNLSRALAIHGDVAFRLDAKNRRQWVKPSRREYAEDASPAARYTGQADFNERAERWAGNAVYSSELLASAAQPFEASIHLEGWPDFLMARAEGRDGGLDGSGADLAEFLEHVLFNVFVSGLHYVVAHPEYRDTESAERGELLWRHVDADDVVFWRWEHRNGRIVVIELCVQAVSPGGYVMRTLYTLDEVAGVVRWEEWISTKKTGATWEIYAPRSESEMLLEFESEPKTGFFEVTAIPVAAYQFDRGIPFSGRPPWKAAAENQLARDRRNNKLDEYMGRVSDSPVLLIQDPDDASDDALFNNARPRMKTFDGKSATVPGPAKWESIDTAHPLHEAQLLREMDEDTRRMVGDPLDQTRRGKETTATEVSAHTERSRRLLDSSRKRLIGPTRSLLDLTADFAGFGGTLSEKRELSFKRTMSAAERQAEQKQMAEIFGASSEAFRVYFMASMEDKELARQMLAGSVDDNSDD